MIKKIVKIAGLVIIVGVGVTFLLLTPQEIKEKSGKIFLWISKTITEKILPKP